MVNALHASQSLKVPCNGRSIKARENLIGAQSVGNLTAWINFWINILRLKHAVKWVINYGSCICSPATHAAKHIFFTFRK